MHYQPHKPTKREIFLLPLTKARGEISLTRKYKNPCI